MGQPTRNLERTRKAILSAATSAVLKLGTSVSLESIAASAGVSKGGVIHHFPTKEALLAAVVRESLAAFRARVHDRVDLTENHPGKLLRAYVRALLDDSELDNSETGDVFVYPGVWRMLGEVQGVPEAIQQEADYWRSNFAADGLDADRTLLAQNAAEGVAANAQWDADYTPEKVRQARDAILSLADDRPGVGI